jgi:hypothetical protein
MKILIDENNLFKILNSYLDGEFYCTRVWDAWNVGTMSRDDFCPIDIDEILQTIKKESISSIVVNL